MADSSEHHTMLSMPTTRIHTPCSFRFNMQGIAAFLLVVAMLTLAGCVQRTISVTSEPQGALVYLNDQEVGRTPLRVPFTFYGNYQVRLERADYVSIDTAQKAKAPWWEAPGPDLIAEMIPNNRVEIAWHFELEKQTDTDPDKVIDHASQLRALLLQESPELDLQAKEPNQTTTQTTTQTPSQNAGE